MLLGTSKYILAAEGKDAIKCVHMYVNAKMTPVETTPGVGGGEGE
jgi:hypothetical protein